MLMHALECLFMVLVGVCASTRETIVVSSVASSNVIVRLLATMYFNLCCQDI